MGSHEWPNEIASYTQKVQMPQIAFDFKGKPSFLPFSKSGQQLRCFPPDFFMTKSKVISKFAMIPCKWLSLVALHEMAARGRRVYCTGGTWQSLRHRSSFIPFMIHFGSLYRGSWWREKRFAHFSVLKWNFPSDMPRGAWPPKGFRHFWENKNLNLIPFLPRYLFSLARSLLVRWLACWLLRCWPFSG